MSDMMSDALPENLPRHLPENASSSLSRQAESKSCWVSEVPVAQLDDIGFRDSQENTDQSAVSGAGLKTLAIAPGRVDRGSGAISALGKDIAGLGQRPLILGGDRTLEAVRPFLEPVVATYGLAATWTSYGTNCSEASLAALTSLLAEHQADVIIGTGGGKALDMAKLLADRHQLPIVTIPTSAATCAAWTALSNIYSDQGAFLYDVGLQRCPNLLILDYDLIQTAPQRMLVAGIGDAIAKWYEASISSGRSPHTLVIAAVQQARVLRDLLLQNSAAALAQPGSAIWREVVDATVLMAGMIGGLGGAQCRTVAAHAVHNGLTHLPTSHAMLHGEKVAFGILAQLRLEEMIQGSQLAATARQQLLRFYQEIGLPCTLADLGLAQCAIADLQHAAEVACHPDSDIHRLPFAVTPEQLMAALVSTTAEAIASSRC